MLKGKYMSSLSHGSDIVQAAQHFCVWVVFLGLAISANTAHSKESSYVNKKDISASKIVRSDSYWQPSYRLSQNIATNNSIASVATDTEFSNAPQLFHFSEPQKKNDWSINIQKQTPSSGDCSPLSSLLCLNSKDEQPDIKTRQDSFWFVLRKAFHF
jgi:hypothetical protein